MKGLTGALGCAWPLAQALAGSGRLGRRRCRGAHAVTSRRAHEAAGLGAADVELITCEERSWGFVFDFAVYASSPPLSRPSSGSSLPAQPAVESCEIQALPWAVPVLGMKWVLLGMKWVPVHGWVPIRCDLSTGTPRVPHR